MDKGQQDGSTRDIVLLGGSSGSLQALKFIADLPSDFPAAIFVVVHAAAEGPALLPDIIRTYSPLPVEHARENEPITPGRIYVAPPDYHLSIARGFVKVARGPKENRHRPSIDVLFRSAAESYGARVIGVVLSGMLDDGSAGLARVRSLGGLGIVQDPEDAMFPGMPRNALAEAGADHCVPQSQLAAILARAVKGEAGESSRERVQEERREGQVSEVSMNRNDDDKPGTPSDFSCPDCGGVLRQIENGKMLRFKCRVGHALTGHSLLAAQSDNIEQALWTALRALEEKIEMARKLRNYAVARNLTSAPKKFEEEATKLDNQARIIRELLRNTEGSEIA